LREIAVSPRAEDADAQDKPPRGGTGIVEFELKYTPAQEEFRNQVRTWLAENVPDGINARPRTVDESRALYLLRRAFGKLLGARGWLYPSGEKQYGGGGLDLDQIIVL
jgi:alkylation response protein AidB-like acyl-CoA dehydrogenase